jgi:transmembrane sensor
MEPEITDRTRIDELITGYFAQGLDDSELAELHEWLTSADGNKNYFMHMQEVWFSAIGAKEEFRFDKEKAFQRFLSRIEVYSEDAQVDPDGKRVFWMGARRIAAAVALLVVFAGSGYWIGNNHINRQITDVTVEAPLGSKTKIYLPDGTLVWLNAGSIISYSQGFGFKDRNVALQGEGYFEVTKNKALPFEVKTSDMKVLVLGTKFNFRNYNDEEEARVTLLEGKVSTTSGLNYSEEHFLSPNQQIILDKKTGSVSISNVNAKFAQIWTEGLIFFDEEKLPDIAKELERSYNVKINIADDSLRKYRFYGNFTRNEQTIQEVLDVLVSTHRLNYKINGKVITLSLR